jgi:hypothetical protein
MKVTPEKGNKVKTEKYKIKKATLRVAFFVL